MRKLKRMVALVTVALFLLSIFAPAAMAASQEDAFGRLKALNVAIGDTTGDPMYDKNFTRAEAAAIMVNLSGMNAAINAAKGATKFKDVPTTHWATGVINLAVGAGIIKGYPDGSYKPDNNVTYAEMSAMLVGVLGYQPRLQGTWPSNVIGQAAQLGLLDGVTVTDYNAPALRSNVFIAADNALDTPVLKEMKDGYEEGKVLMVEKLNVTKRTEGIVINVPNYGKAKGKVQIDPDTTKAGDDFEVTVADGVDPNAHYGEKVVAWEKDDKVFFFDVKTSSSSIIRDELDANYDPVNNQIELKDDDKKYTLAAAPVIKRNFANDVAGSLLKGDKVKVVLDGNGKVAYIEAWSYQQALVDEVKVSDEKIVFTEPSGSLDLNDDVVTIIKNGSVIDLEDINSGDVLDYVENGAKDITNIYVTDAVITGKLTAASQTASSYKLTIGEKATSTLNRTIALSDDNGDSFTAAVDSDSFRGYFNKDVTAKLNKDGKIAFLIAGSADDATEIPVFVRAIQNGNKGLDTATYIRAGRFDGINVDYEVTKDTDYDNEDVNDAAFTAVVAPATTFPAIITKDGDPLLAVNSIVKLTLTADGEVDTIKSYNAANIETDALNVMPISKDNDTITINGKAFKVNADTKIIKLDTTTAALEVDDLSWNAVENLANAAGNLVLSAVGKLTAVVDNGVVKYMAILDNVTDSSDFKYGVIASHGTDAVLGAFTEIDINGTYNKYKNNIVAGAIADKDLVQFKVDSNNKITLDSELTAITITGAVYDTYVVKSVNKSNKIITVIPWDGSAEYGTTKYYPLYDSNVEVYSLKDAKLADKTIDDLSSGDKIKIYDDRNSDGDADSADGAIDWIIIQDIK